MKLDTLWLLGSSLAQGTHVQTPWVGLLRLWRWHLGTLYQGSLATLFTLVEVVYHLELHVAIVFLLRIFIFTKSNILASLMYIFYIALYGWKMRISYRVTTTYSFNWETMIIGVKGVIILSCPWLCTTLIGGGGGFHVHMANILNQPVIFMQDFEGVGFRYCIGLICFYLCVI